MRIIVWKSVWYGYLLSMVVLIHVCIPKWTILFSWACIFRSLQFLWERTFRIPDILTKLMLGCWRNNLDIRIASIFMFQVSELVNLLMLRNRISSSNILTAKNILFNILGLSFGQLFFLILKRNILIRNMFRHINMRRDLIILRSLVRAEVSNHWRLFWGLNYMIIIVWILNNMNRN